MNGLNLDARFKQTQLPEVGKPSAMFYNLSFPTVNAFSQLPCLSCNVRMTSALAITIAPGLNGPDGKRRASLLKQRAGAFAT
jgi:hypothetical protein